MIRCWWRKDSLTVTSTAYVMYKMGLGWDNALKFVTAKRPVVCPNYGFLSQLEKFEAMLKDGSFKITEARETEIVTVPVAKSVDAPIDCSYDMLLYWYHTSKSTTGAAASANPAT